MLGLGLGTDKNSPKASGSSGFSSSILFERNEDWVAGDVDSINGAGFTSCSLSIGTSEVAGVSNYLIMTKTGGGSSDPQVFYGSSKFSAYFSTDPQDIFEAGSGSFKLTAKCYIPSGNTATGSGVRIRVNGTSAPSTLAEDGWGTFTRTKAISACSAPEDDFDFFELEFDDSTTSEPNDGDVMYVAQFKVEFIAD
tara:strand:- start:1614 stop:2198 length:585 start_codon:yes stop_codon:yes gene_type:complete